jgi:hypothetical protein
MKPDPATPLPPNMRTYFSKIGQKGRAVAGPRYQWTPEQASAASKARWAKHGQAKTRRDAGRTSKATLLERARAYAAGSVTRKPRQS